MQRSKTAISMISLDETDAEITSIMNINTNNILCL